MRSSRPLAFLLTLGLALGAAVAPPVAAGASLERPVSGWVTQVHPLSGIVELESSVELHVPPDVYDLWELPVGAWVVITLERRGGRSVATSIQIRSYND